ncbi:MAG: hypothetical protein A3I10_04000 [Deltaproteobacteria bacterium RIFCSPLOWO2_02_FULL_57_26]|nr:MAG: hypothetical protein A3I10_04000 [Deltaproteobacteria bacterium RIFCSPLOWO2_02_FULL_57_26]OGQ77104.1 MAG: hypothetical protein A3G40_12530 [Deltaproteobacteria bacterium RIFCSPLOWO2_12_FULL_57_22]
MTWGIQGIPVCPKEPEIETLCIWDRHINKTVRFEDPGNLTKCCLGRCEVLQNMMQPDDIEKTIRESRIFNVSMTHIDSQAPCLGRSRGTGFYSIHIPTALFQPMEIRSATTTHIQKISATTIGNSPFGSYIRE